MRLFRNNILPLALLLIMLSTAHSEESILTFRLVHPDQDKLSQQSSKAKIDKKRYELFVKDNENIWIDKKVELDVKDIKSVIIRIITKSDSGEQEYLPITLAQIDRNPDLKSPSMNAFSALLTFTKEGETKMQNVTERNIHRKLAVILNKRILMAPRIQDKITRDEMAISGLTYDETRSLSGVINNGMK